MRSIEWGIVPMTVSPPNHPKPPHFMIFCTAITQRVHLETTSLVYRLTIASPTVPMKNLSWKGRGQDHVSNFYIVDLENFNTASQSSVYRYYQQTRRRSACGLHLRRSRASWLNAQVYYTLVDCNPLTPLLRFVLDLSYKLLVHCYAAVGKNSTEMSRRAVRLQ